MSSKIMICAAAGALLLAGIAGASQYQGQEARDIKALSEGEIQGYLNGAGMGFARPAELNHYPGPKHVLELAEPLDLSSDQAAAVQRSFDKMHARAVDLGAQLVAAERQLDEMFADATATQDALHGLVLETARIRGELRYTHLLAHTEMKSVLTAEQIREYDRLRGYQH